MMNEAQQKKVLIIDDEAEMTRLLKIELEQEGFKAFVARDGQEGFSQIRTIMPDVIILDIMMPGMDGYEMLTILKADDATQNIPVILLTAKTREQDIEKGKKLGADSYITKPFDSIQLVREVHRISRRG